MNQRVLKRKQHQPEGHFQSSQSLKTKICHCKILTIINRESN